MGPPIILLSHLAGDEAELTFSANFLRKKWQKILDFHNKFINLSIFFWIIFF